MHKRHRRKSDELRSNSFTWTSLGVSLMALSLLLFLPMVRNSRRLSMLSSYIQRSNEALNDTLVAAVSLSLGEEEHTNTKPIVLSDHQRYLANCSQMIQSPGDGLTAVVDVSNYSRTTTTNFTMATHLLRHDMVVSKLIRTKGCFDCELWDKTLSALTRYQHEDAFLLDIGSNIGIFGLSAAAMGVDVYGFEPFKKNWRRICQTLNMNPASFQDRFTLFQTALSSQGPQRMSFNMRWKTNPSALKIVTNNEAAISDNNDREEGVDYGWAITLDSIQASLPKGRPVVIKIDVEGHECETFAGGMSYLNQLDSRHVIMELNADPLRNCFNRQELFALMAKNALSPTKWEHGTGQWVPKPINVSDLTEWLTGTAMYNVEWSREKR